MHRPESGLRIVFHGQELLREFRRRRFDQRTAQLVAGGGDIGEFILRRQGRRRQRSGQGQQGEGHFRGSVHALRFLRVCGNCRSGTGGGEGTGEHKSTKSGRHFTIPRSRSAEYRGAKNDRDRKPVPGDGRTKIRSPVRIRTFRPSGPLWSRFEDRTKFLKYVNNACKGYENP